VDVIQDCGFCIIYLSLDSILSPTPLVVGLFFCLKNSYSAATPSLRKLVTHKSVLLAHKISYPSALISS